jgi:hypothetical protein
VNEIPGSGSGRLSQSPADSVNLLLALTEDNTIPASAWLYSEFLNIRGVAANSYSSYN